MIVLLVLYLQWTFGAVTPTAALILHLPNSFLPSCRLLHLETYIIIMKQLLHTDDMMRNIAVSSYGRFSLLG